jgi:hypothetical protein
LENASCPEVQKLRSIDKRADSYQKAGCLTGKSVTLNCMPTFFTNSPVAVPDNPSVRSLIGKKIFIHLGPSPADVVHCKLSLEPMAESDTRHCLQARNIACGPGSWLPSEAAVSTQRCLPTECWFITPTGVDAIKHEPPSADLRLPWSE